MHGLFQRDVCVCGLFTAQKKALDLSTECNLLPTPSATFMASKWWLHSRRHCASPSIRLSWRRQNVEEWPSICRHQCTTICQRATDLTQRNHCHEKENEKEGSVLVERRRVATEFDMRRTLRRGRALCSVACALAADCSRPHVHFIIL